MTFVNAERWSLIRRVQIVTTIKVFNCFYSTCRSRGWWAVTEINYTQRIRWFVKKNHRTVQYVVRCYYSIVFVNQKISGHVRGQYTRRSNQTRRHYRFIYLLIFFFLLLFFYVIFLRVKTQKRGPWYSRLAVRIQSQKAGLGRRHGERSNIKFWFWQTFDSRSRGLFVHNDRMRIAVKVGRRLVVIS